jgi:murein DD-endopeptidase MepM/ murein hydrolase activator NlpD
VRTALVALAIAFLALGADRAAVTADTSPNPQQQLSVIEQVRAQLGSNLANALAAQEQLRISLQQNAAQQAVLQGKIDTVKAKIADLDSQIASAQLREAQLSAHIDAERMQLRQLARAIYTAPGSALLVLAESQSLGDLLTRISDLNVAGNRATEIKSALTTDLGTLQALRQKEQAARDDQVTQRDRLTAELAQVQVLEAQQQKSLVDLQAKIDETNSELAQLKRQSAQLAQQVADMLTQQEDAVISAAMQSVWTQVQLWEQSNAVGQIPISAGHSKQYRFVWPEPQGQISQPFGPSSLVLEPAYGGYPHFHTGIDLVEPFGLPVNAADDGVVALVGAGNTGYGNYVVIAHAGGLTTLYGHLASALVKVGQQVVQGEPIGLEGSTGNSTGAHCHFELRINQQPVNPAPYLPPGAPSPFKG